MAVEHAADQTPSCIIEIVVKRDTERFLSAEDFREHVTPQALRQFKAIRIAVRGRGIGVDVMIARAPVQRLGLSTAPGVLVCVGAAEDHCADKVKELRDTVGHAISRGTFFFSRPARSETTTCGEGPEVVLRQKAFSRLAVLVTLYSFGAVTLMGFLMGMRAGLEREPVEGPLPELIGGLLVVLIALVMVLMFLAVEAGRTAIGAIVARWAHRLIFPAVEVAARTPGRRIARGILRLVTLGIGPALGLAAKALFAGG